jgi:hypothetical protein
MLTEAMTIPNEREKQPVAPDGEIAPPGSPNLAACPNCSYLAVEAWFISFLKVSRLRVEFAIDLGQMVVYNGFPSFNPTRDQEFLWLRL